MGRSVTPRYRIEGRETTGKTWVACWRGRATGKRLEAYVHALNESMKPGGVNGHVHEALQIRPPVTSSAKIVDQFTGQVVVEFVLPMFQVI